jgi:hypothetical protein
MKNIEKHSYFYARQIKISSEKADTNKKSLPYLGMPELKNGLI